MDTIMGLNILYHLLKIMSFAFQKLKSTIYRLRVTIYRAIVRAIAGYLYLWVITAWILAIVFVGVESLKELLLTMLVSISIFIMGIIYQMIFHPEKFLPKKWRKDIPIEEDQTKLLIEKVTLLTEKVMGLIEEIKKGREARIV